VAPGANVTLAAPPGHINVHVRDGAAIPLHAAPACTVAETRRGPFELLVVQAPDGVAMGEAYVDNGESAPPTPSKVRALIFRTEQGSTG
jgi:alpha-glucosidase